MPDRRQHLRHALGQQPLSLGADVVVANASKALSGHSDLLAGTWQAAGPSWSPPCSANDYCGAILEAWLLLRSLASAGLRFERKSWPRTMATGA